jgi:hypothetical protein
MKKIFLSIASLIMSVLVYGQPENLTLQLGRILFGDLVDTIESKIPVRIYYSDNWTDSLYLTVNSKNSTLNEVLNKALTREGFTFIITDNKKVILSKGTAIKTGFKKEYLDHLKERYSRDTITYVIFSSEKEESSINEEYRVFKIGKPSAAVRNGRTELTGTVINASNGEPVAGAVVYIENLQAGVVTNDVGYYSFILPPGQYRIEYRMVGMRPTLRNVIIYSNGGLDVGMQESTSRLSEVIVTAERESIVRNVSIGIEKINTRMIRQIPMGLGEADIIKSSLLLPGIQTVGEASGGYNVRGGNSDQNLVLLDYAPIINSSHFFGFFSAFNSDLVSNVTLYKNGTPAKFGGRISSVMEITPHDADREKVKISGGISPVTGRIMAEGPLVNDKYSFMIGTRATYSDWLLGILKDGKLQNSKAGFYDIQGVLTGRPDARNSFSLSGYLSKDNFEYYKESAFKYGNLAATLKWKHTFNSKLSSQYFAIISKYNYRLDAIRDSTEYNSVSYRLNQKILRADFSYMPIQNYKMEFGADAVWYDLMPGAREPFGDYSVISSGELEKERALEPSLYFSGEYEISPLISVSGGLRGTLFTSFGPKTVYQYGDDLPLSVENIKDSVYYGKRDIVKVYPALEFRFSGRIILTQDASLKLGFQRMYQNIHMISNTTSMSPTDIWKLSDRYIRPQRGDQISLGLYHSYGRRAIQTSVETYYQWLANIHDYKGGATLLMNRHLETDIITGRGKAYGVEFMVRKMAGSLTGWISYTYSRVLLQVDGRFSEEKVNGGHWFPANYDKPHDIKTVINAKLSRRFNISANLVYNTGRPITFPVAFFSFNNSSNVYYSNRNEYRIPDYFRVDLSATLNGNLKIKKLNHSSFTATIYNLLGRKNPYSIFFKNEEGVVKGYQMTIFAQPFLIVTYNFRIFGNATDDF